MNEIAELGTGIKLKQVIALSPQEADAAKRQIIQHCVFKMNEAHKEMVEAEENLTFAIENSWNVGRFRRQVQKHKKRIEYYNKLRLASEKGYLIIPSFGPWMLDVFAVRTNMKNETPTWKPMRVLAAGEGRYVSPVVQTYTDEVPHQIEPNKMVTKDFPCGLVEDIDFPAVIVKPQILQATQAALADKIFDHVGIVRQGGDPIVVGEIRHPASNRYISFFVAWWLDVDQL